MADSVPTKLRAAQIAPFAKRAAQLERFKPIITYWLHFYIVQKIIASNLHTTDAECAAYTTDLMERLEQTKADNPTEDALLDKTAAYAYCEQFALQTFAKGEREMTANAVTKNTADTLLAASTFLELLTVWNKDPEPEIKSKQTFAKYHAVRILKALQAGEDPNLTNPVHEPPPQAASPSALDPDDPEVQHITQSAEQPQNHNPYQAYVETSYNTSAPPSPNFSSHQISPPQSHIPSAPTDYSHRDVSPISQPDNSRHGSVVSAGGGYFPKVDVPTFTADNAEPSLPTAPSIVDEPMVSPFASSPLPSGSQLPQASHASDPHNFYNQPTSPSPPPAQPSQQPNPFAFPQQPQPQPQPQSPLPPSHQQPPFQNPPPSQPSQPPQPLPQQFQPQALSHASQHTHQGPFNTDEESQMDATKHAKWAISALNFEDVNTAVKELRLALRALGAN